MCHIKYLSLAGYRNLSKVPNVQPSERWSQAESLKRRGGYDNWGLAKVWPFLCLLTEVRDNLDCGGLRSSTAIEKWRGVVHHVYVESLVQGVIQAQASKVSRLSLHFSSFPLLSLFIGNIELIPPFPQHTFSSLRKPSLSEGNSHSSTAASSASKLHHSLHSCFILI